MNSLLDGNEDLTIDPNKNYLEELVGEGKKFKTPEELARGKYEADVFIETLKRRNDEIRTDYLKLREDHMAGKNLEDMVDQILSRKEQSNSNQPPANDVQPPKLDKEIESLVSTKIQEFEMTRKQTENWNRVKSKLEEQYGSNFKTVLNAKAESLGLSGEDVDALARKSPEAFFNTFGFNVPKKEESFQAPPASARRSDSFAPTTQKRTWSYYQSMKEKDPAAYHNPKTQVQMHNDYIALGKEFEDGDFSRF